MHESTYTIVAIDDKTQWEEFVREHCFTTFMQSWDWGDFEKTNKNNVYRLGIKKDESLIALAQVIEVHAKRGKFLGIPHGPLFHSSLVSSPGTTDVNKENQTIITDCLSNLTAYLKKLGKEKNCVCIRINPTLPDNTNNVNLFKKIGYRKAAIYMTSENAVVMEIKGKSDDELLALMRKTTRYLIRNSSKHDLVTEINDNPEALKSFMDLYRETSDREGFVGFSTEYIGQEFEAFQKDNQASILTTFQQQNPELILSSAIIIFTKNAAFYHQGASNHPKIPAPYALQWSAIKHARDRGCLYYNFWGTYIKGRTPHSWAGLSQFKLGFSNTTWSYLPTQDYILSPRYWLSYLSELMIAWRRGVYF